MDTKPGPKPIWACYIGEDIRPTDDASVGWVMHLELAEALRELGWAVPREYNDPFHDVGLAAEELDEELPTFREALILSRVGPRAVPGTAIALLGRMRRYGGELRRGAESLSYQAVAHPSNRERLDPYNGLLLIGTLDPLIDAGLITFDGEGWIVVSPELSASDRSAIGLKSRFRLRALDMLHLPYLAFHRSEVFGS